MSHDSDLKYRRKFTKDQLKGRHHITITPELNMKFLEECEKERRVPADWLRIILEDRYSSEVHYPKSVEGKPHGVERQDKREVA